MGSDNTRYSFGPVKIAVIVSFDAAPAWRWPRSTRKKKFSAHIHAYPAANASHGYSNPTHGVDCAVEFRPVSSASLASSTPLGPEEFNHRTMILHRDLRPRLTELGREAASGDLRLSLKNGAMNLHPLLLAAVSSLLREALAQISDVEDKTVIAPDLAVEDVETFLRLLWSSGPRRRDVKKVSASVNCVCTALAVDFDASDVLEASSSGGALVSRVSEEEVAEERCLSDVDIMSLSDDTISDNFSDQHARLVCLICYKIFPPGQVVSYKEHVFSHKRAALSKIRFQWKRRPECDVCRLRFQTEAELIRHRKVSHKQVKKPRCLTCDKEFVDGTRLLIHSRLHTGERPFKCDVCGKTFTQRRTLHEHKLTHEQQRKFECDQCNKRFVQRNHLKYHRASVHGVADSGRHECPYCKKLFAFPFQLVKHQAMHDKKMLQMQVTT